MAPLFEALGSLNVYQALRDVEDLPEDFLSRADSALDEETRRRLRSGIKGLRRVARIRVWGFRCFLVGGPFLLALLPAGAAGWDGSTYLMAAWLLAWLVAGICYAGSVGSYLRHRREIEDVRTFVRARRGSDLSRM